METLKTLLDLEEVKIPFDKDIEVCGVKGHARYKITHAEKKRMAIETAALVYSFDEANGVITGGLDSMPAFAYEILKYYTDIDTDCLVGSNAFDYLYDNVCEDDGYNTLYESIVKDLNCVIKLTETIYNNVDRIYKATHDPMNRLYKLLASIPTTDEAGSKIGESRPINEVLIDIIDKANKYSEEHENKFKDGSQPRMINFAKKQ